MADIDMNINVNPVTLKEILCIGENFYSIPMYQRPYSWGKEHVETLLDDLLNAYQHQQKLPYFCGSLVITKPKNGKDRYDIIDGQQRITTFIILACVLRNFFPEFLDKRTEKYVLHSIEDDIDNTPRLKLLTDEENQNNFLQTVLGKIDVNLSHKGNKYLENAKNLKQHLEKKSIESKEKKSFFSWIYNHVVLAKIECNNEDTAIQIFNILNDRGLPLTSVDVIKSKLMQQITDLEKRKTFKTEWDIINKNLKSQDLNINDMFNAYLYYCIAQNPNELLHKELEKYFKNNYKQNDDGILKIIYDIKRFSYSYVDILKLDNDSRYALEYLPHRVYWTSILATSKFEKYDWHEELKKCLISYYYKNWIGGGTINRIKQSSFNIIQEIKKKNPISDIKDIIINSIKDWDMQELYKNALNRENVYDNTKWIKPILCMLEYKYKVDPNFIPLNKKNNKLEIEHILPINPKEKEWTQITDEEKSELTHCLGNLTLLSRIKNRQALNFGYNKKINTYMDKDDVATSFEISRRITRKYEEWTADTIKERKEELINDINDMLSI